MVADYFYLLDGEAGVRQFAGISVIATIDIHFRETSIHSTSPRLRYPQRSARVMTTSRREVVGNISLLARRI
ncbi:MAG TPA: hypothetical protein VGW97_02910, partial [Chthoniobacterales bacterium]|nr:hypothetical protein [Chthoniobacterales bacterium]